MNKNKILAISNAIALVVIIFINYLANALPINGKSTGELSDAYPNMFVPAGFTFAIWGVIYLGLIAFVIYQLFAAFSKKIENPEFINKIGIWFIISCIANGSWIFAWHYQMIPLSLVIMLCILGSLIMIYQRLQIGLVNPRSAIQWLVHTPFSIYLGWITVATIANVTTFLVDMSWDGFGILDELWTVFVLMIGIYIGQNMLGKRKDIAYALVIIWAYYGIYAKRTGLGAALDSSIVMTTLIGMGILTLLSLYQLFVRLKKN